MSTTSRLLKALGLIACGFVSAPLLAQGVSVHSMPQLDSTAVTAGAIEAGRAIFHGAGTCFACHGMNLEGGPIAPTLKAHAWKAAKGGELSAIYYVVTHGVNGTAMVSHPGGISDQDAAHVAEYVWAVGHRGIKP